MALGTLYQTTTPAEGVTDFLSRLLDPAGAYGEGLYWTGSGTVGGSYPPFLALVRDDSGRVWPAAGPASR